MQNCLVPGRCEPLKIVGGICEPSHDLDNLLPCRRFGTVQKRGEIEKCVKQLTMDSVDLRTKRHVYIVAVQPR